MEEEETVEDSLGSDIENATTYSHPLGNLCKIMTDSTSDNFEYMEGYDSDITVKSDFSCQLSIGSPKHHKVGSDDDTCLSSNFSEEIPQSQVSLFPTQTKSGNNLDTDLCVDKVESFGDGLPTGMKKCKQLASSQPRRRSKRKRRKLNSAHFVEKEELLPSTQSQVSAKIFRKSHCWYMEELNMIEAKLSSVEKLLSMKSRHYTEEAKLVMKGDVIPRITAMRKNILEMSDSSSDEEREKLQEVRTDRMEEILKHHNDVKKQLEDFLSQEYSEDNDMEYSLSMLPSTLKQLRTEVSHHFTKSSHLSQNAVSILQSTRINSNSSVIYVPALSTAEPKIYESYRRFVNHSRKLPYSTAIGSMRTSKQAAYSSSNLSNRAAVTSLKSSNNLMKISNISNSISSSVNSQVAGCNSNLRQLSQISQNQPNQSGEAYSTINQSAATFSTINQSAVTYPMINQPTMAYSTINQCLSNHLPTIQPTVDNNCCLDLNDLLKSEAISRGPGVLSCTIKGFTHSASVVGNGLILSLDYQVHVSPMTWLKSITKRNVSRVVAYKQIYFNGETLLDISRRSMKRCSGFHSGTTVVSAGETGAPVISAPRSSALPEPSTVPSVSKHSSCTEPDKIPDTAQSSLVSIKTPVNPLDDLSNFLKSCRIRLVQNDELFVTSSLFPAHSFSLEDADWLFDE